MKPIIDASNLKAFGQALLSLGIRLLVIGSLAGLDYLAKVYTGFAWPAPQLTLPLVGGVISEADAWLVKWEKDNIPAV